MAEDDRSSEREANLRTVLGRFGLALRESGGGYQVVDASTMEAVAGAQGPNGYSMSLKDAEDFAVMAVWAYGKPGRREQLEEAIRTAGWDPASPHAGPPKGAAFVLSDPPPPEPQQRYVPVKTNGPQAENDRPESSRSPGGVPDHPVLAPEDAGKASLYRIVERLAPLDQKMFRAGSTGGLPVEDHLELLALNAAAARAAVSRRGWEMARALWAGATWHQVAKATGLTVAEARAEFGDWGSGLVAQRARDMTRRTFEEEVGRYLRAGDEESLRLVRP